MNFLSVETRRALEELENGLSDQEVIDILLGFSILEEEEAQDILEEAKNILRERFWKENG